MRINSNYHDNKFVLKWHGKPKNTNQSKLMNCVRLVWVGQFQDINPEPNQSEH